MSKTLNYYNDNAERFVQETANVDISKNQKEFLKYIPDNGRGRIGDNVQTGVFADRDSCKVYAV